MAKKFYAVKAGYKPGVYTTWDECKKQVDGFPGASYKGFSSQREAEDFLNIAIDSNITSLIFIMITKVLLNGVLGNGKQIKMEPRPTKNSMMA